MNTSNLLNKYIIGGAVLVTSSLIKSPIQKGIRIPLAKLALFIGAGSLASLYLKQKNLNLKTIVKYSTITVSALAIGAASFGILPTTQKILSLKMYNHLKCSFIRTAAFLIGTVLPPLHHLIKPIFESTQEDYDNLNNTGDTTTGALPDEPECLISLFGGHSELRRNLSISRSNTNQDLAPTYRALGMQQMENFFKISPKIASELLRNQSLLQQRSTITINPETSIFSINSNILERFFRTQNGLLRNPSYYASLVSSQGDFNICNSEPAGDRIQEITEESSYLIKDALKDFKTKPIDEYVLVSLSETEQQEKINSAFLSYKETQADAQQALPFQGDIEQDADLKELIDKIPALRGLAQEIQDYIDNPSNSLADLAIQLVCTYNKKLVNIFEKTTKKVPGSDELTLAGDALMSLQKNTKLHIAIQNIYNYLNSDETLTVPPELAITLLYYFSFFCKKSSQEIPQHNNPDSFLKKIRFWLQH